MRLPQSQKICSLKETFNPCGMNKINCYGYVLISCIMASVSPPPARGRQYVVLGYEVPVERLNIDLTMQAFLELFMKLV